MFVSSYRCVYVDVYVVFTLHVCCVVVLLNDVCLSIDLSSVFVCLCDCLPACLFVCVCSFVVCLLVCLCVCAC